MTTPTTPTPPPTTTTVDARTGISVRMGEALGQIALLPAALRGAFLWILYDIVTHQRTSVLKHHKLRAGRPAQQMLATRIFRYTKAADSENRVAELMGETFVAAVAGSDAGAGYVENPRFFQLLETGGESTSGAPRAVPIAAGLLRRGGSVRVNPKFKELLKAKAFDVVPRKGKLPLLVYSPESGRERSVIYGVLAKRLDYGPQLNFYKQWNSVLARGLPKMEKGLERAATAAGQAALADRDALVRAGKEAYLETLKQMSTRGIKGRQAKRAAQLAESAAKKDYIAGKGTG